MGTFSKKPRQRSDVNTAHADDNVIERTKADGTVTQFIIYRLFRSQNYIKSMANLLIVGLVVHPERTESVGRVETIFAVSSSNAMW